MFGGTPFGSDLQDEQQTHLRKRRKSETKSKAQVIPVDAQYGQFGNLPVGKGNIYSVARSSGLGRAGHVRATMTQALETMTARVADAIGAQRNPREATERD